MTATERTSDGTAPDRVENPVRWPNGRRNTSCNAGKRVVMLAIETIIAAVPAWVHKNISHFLLYDAKLRKFQNVKDS
jgi:hypothetical protein